LIELPQQDARSPTLVTAKLITNASVKLVKKAARGYSITRNGVGTGTEILMQVWRVLVLTQGIAGVRFLQTDGNTREGQPWGVRAFKAEPAWYGGLGRLLPV